MELTGKMLMEKLNPETIVYLKLCGYRVGLLYRRIYVENNVSQYSLYYSEILERFYLEGDGEYIFRSTIEEIEKEMLDLL